MRRPDRPADRLDEEQTAELEALDRALAGAPAAELGAEHAQLATLVAAVRDDRPLLRRAFAAELDGLVSDRFPRRAARSTAAAESEPPRRRRRPAARHWLTGLGLSTALVVAAVVVAGSFAPARPQSATSQRPQSATLQPGPAGPGGAGSAAVPSAAGPGSVSSAPAPGVTGSSGAAAPPAVAAPAPAPAAAAAGARAVQRDASLGLLAPHGRVQQVADQAIAATDRLGGIVESSNVTIDDHGGSQASLELRVPGTGLDRALAVLSGLAHVSSRAQNGLDITDPTGAARDRLAASRAERDALLRQLAAATSANQVASIHARLGLVDGRIGQDRGQLQALLQRAAVAHLSVTIGEDQAAAGGAVWGAGTALDDALTVLEAVFSVLVIALAGLLPAALLGALAWWAWRPLRRRRREGVLGGTDH